MSITKSEFVKYLIPRVGKNPLSKFGKGLIVIFSFSTILGMIFLILYFTIYRIVILTPFTFFSFVVIILSN